MRITFLGTGSAFDPERSTTSLLLEYEFEGSSKTMMLDCGYSAPMSLLRLLKHRGELETLQPVVPDTLVVTHQHGDHIGGLPRLLIPAWLAGRKTSLRIIANNGTIDSVTGARSYSTIDALKATFDIHHPMTRRKLMNFFDTSYEALESLEVLDCFMLSTALTRHPVLNRAIRLDWKVDGVKKSFAYSGDGGFTDASKELFAGVDVLVHETLLCYDELDGHENVKNVIEFAAGANIGTVYCVHLDWAERSNTVDLDRILAEAKDLKVNLIFPEDHDSFELPL